MIRLLKIVLVILVGLQGLFYFLSNLMNFSSAKIAVGAVLSQADSPFYQNAVAPAVTSPELISLALIGIMAGELLIGLVSFKGAVDMGLKIGAPAPDFERAKKWAILGCGLALIVWFGIFQVFGAALYQMWQGEIGVSSFEGAFIYHAASGIIMLFVNQPDR